MLILGILESIFNNFFWAVKNYTGCVRCISTKFSIIALIYMHLNRIAAAEKSCENFWNFFDFVVSQPYSWRSLYVHNHLLRAKYLSTFAIWWLIGNRMIIAVTETLKKRIPSSTARRKKFWIFFGFPEKNAHFGHFGVHFQ